MTVLVTGGSGFLGSYMVRMLVAAGHRVKVLLRPTSDLSLLAETADQIERVEGDVLDYFSLLEGMQDVEQVYHSAAVVSFLKSDREHMLRTNVEGTANVVNAALEVGIPKLLHVSSIAALGRTGKAAISDEQDKWENSKLNSDYAISKFGAEREVWRAMAEGLSAVIVNPSMIIGAGHWNAGTSVFFKRVEEGLKFYSTGATGIVDVRDVAAASIQLMNSDIVGKRFILSGENMLLRDYLYLIADALGKNRPTVSAGAFLLGLAWRMEGLKSKLSGSKPFLTRQSAMVALNKSSYSNAAITAALNYQFKSAAETVADTSAVFKSAVQSGRGFGVLPI